MARLVITIDIDTSTAYDPKGVADDLIRWPHEIEVEGDEKYFSIVKAKWKTPK